MELKKVRDGDYLQSIMRVLPIDKVKYLKEIATTVNVGNQSRQIFKIKR
jgi:hypothetical protein